jgi:alpha-ketoglutarate-dependent taurine dioxygenase
MVVSTEEIGKINQLTYGTLQSDDDLEMFKAELSDSSISESFFRDKVHPILVQNKFVILQTDPKNFSTQILFDLNQFLGTIIVQEYGHTDRGLFKIQQTEFGQTTAKSNKAQPLHTDHCFGYGFPNVLCLYCEQQSKLGGYSKLVRATDVYKYLQNVSPESLQREHSLNYVTRHGEYPAKNIFKHASGNLALYWSPFTSYVQGSHEAEELYRSINLFCQNPQNQITYRLKAGELLIIDNMAMLHSRTEFENGDNRIVYRMWYDGKSEFDLQTGFII